MMYEPMAAREYRSGQEMKAAYSQLRQKHFERARQEIAAQCERDEETITSLRNYTLRQFNTINQLVEQAKAYQARIDELRLGLAGSQEEFSRIEARRKAAEASIAVEQSAVSFVKVLAAVSTVYQLSPAVIKGPSRDKQAVAARRHVVRILSANRPDLSLPLIGKLLGGRDHSTVLHARNTWADVEPFYRRQNEAIEAILGIGQPVDNAHKLAEDQPVTPCDDKIAACG